MSDNHKIKNIYHMLSYAYRSLYETGFKNVGAEDFENIHDLFAAIISRGVGGQIKRGLHRDYVPRDETTSSPRGKILVTESLKRQTIPQGKLFCAYDEFTEDSPHNQVLKSTMRMLLRHGRVKSENKKALRKLLLYFNGVTEIAPTAIRWDGLKFHRNNASYRTLVNICRLAVKGLLLNTNDGNYKLVSWLDDDKMHHLYERFVLSYYQHHHPSYNPKAAEVKWDLRGGADCAYLPGMKTDITLTNGERSLIIDTKYYSRAMLTNPQFNRTTFISAHMYQIFAYVKNKDKESTGNVAGVLLYAKTDEEITPDGDFNIGGNQIGIRALDLNRDWNEITEQLDRLCGYLTQR